MKKIILCFLVSLFFFPNSSIGQEGKDEIKARFDRFKAELELSEEQKAQLNELFKERREKMNDLQLNKKGSLDNKAERMRNMKIKREMNEKFQADLKTILNEEQMMKVNEYMGERREQMKMRELKNKPQRMHKHENGEYHEH